MRLTALVFLFVVALLIGCSGGGGGGSAPPARQPTPMLTGTAAANEPLASYAVEVWTVVDGRVSGGSHGPATGPDGHYTSIVVPGEGPPFVLRGSRPPADAEPQYPRVYSISNRAGTAQVTPLTSLLVARLLNRKPLYLGVDQAAVLALQGRSDAELAAAREQVVAYLLARPSKDNGNLTAPVDVSAVTDFVTMPLTAAPGNPYFEALRRLHDSLMDSETIDGMEEHMLSGSDPPADLRAILALDFLANCTIEGVDDGTLPRGSTRIIFTPRGITFGTVDFPFQTGDLFRVSAGQRFGGTGWQFESTARRTRVDLSVNDEDGVVGVDLSRPIGDSKSHCQAIGEVPLSGKRPSLMALIGLLGQSIANPNFQCAAPVAAGFQVGTNRLDIEQNGALRINGPGGPTLHLPSQDIRVTASITVVGGAVAPIRMGLFTTTRVFRSGPDTLAIDVAEDGRISLVELGRSSERSSLFQRCRSI